VMPSHPDARSATESSTRSIRCFVELCLIIVQMY
jgi:hypothetical protein